MGLTIGAALYFAAVGLSALLIRMSGASAAEKLRLLQWLASTTSVFMPGLAPFVAFGMSVLAVAKLLHL